MSSDQNPCLGIIFPLPINISWSFMSGFCCQPPCLHHEAIKIELVFVLLFTKIITCIYVIYHVYTYMIYVAIICTHREFCHNMFYASLAVHFGMDDQRSTMICIRFLLATNLHHSILYTFVWLESSVLGIPFKNWVPQPEFVVHLYIWSTTDARHLTTKRLSWICFVGVFLRLYHAIHHR